MRAQIALIGILAVTSVSAQGIFEGGARFLGAEPGRPGRVVRNAPYSADVVTESSQTLPDGNHIRQSNTVHIVRDSEGRTRSEQSLRTLGGLAPNAHLPQVVFINDPVTNSNYALNLNSRTATKSTVDRPPMRRPEGGFRRGGLDANSKVESLGRQTMEGLAVDGTRTTLTVPAGQIGNDQPLQVVTETWYSADLQTVVLSRRTDPRTGETVTRLTNVSRAEPAHSLFEVPADFKVSESQNRPGRGPR